MASLQQWYKTSSSSQPDEFPTNEDLLQTAFKQACEKFSFDMTKDRKKRNFTWSFDTIHDVQEAVNSSMARYESHRKTSAASTWLVCFSQRIKLYGEILDVLAQHHPEYVSLAWGAMKFLFTSVINHEKTTATLAKAMSEIAEILPRVQLATHLYPTEKMKNALCELYAHILRFLIRAHDWYKEGSLKHIVHSITRPVELRYDDLLQNISQSSRVIEQLASSGHRAEFRDMHNEIDASLKHSTQQLTEIRAAVSNHSIALSATTECLSHLLISQGTRFEGIRTELDGLRTKVEQISTAVSLQSTSLVDTNQLVTSSQFTQIMAILAKSTIYDPIKALRYHQLMRHRPSHIPLRPLSNRFWQTTILRRWSGSQDCDIALIKGNYNSRFALRHLIVDIIEQLQTFHVPVMQATKPAAQIEATSSGDQMHNSISLSDLISSLIHQGLQVLQQQQPPGGGGGGNVQTERSMARSCAQYLGTETPEELFQLLKAVLCEIHGQVYIVVDLGVFMLESQQQHATGLASNIDRNGNFTWLESFLAFFSELSERGNKMSALSKPTIKVLLVSYDALPPFSLSTTSQSSYVVQARTEVVTARCRKSRRHITVKQSQLGLGLSKLQLERKPVGGKGKAYGH